MARTPVRARPWLWLHRGGPGRPHGPVPPRLPHATDQLDRGVHDRRARRVQVVHRGQQGRRPRRHPHGVATGQGGLEVGLGRGAERLGDLDVIARDVEGMEHHVSTETFAALEKLNRYLEEHPEVTRQMKDRR